VELLTGAVQVRLPKLKAMRPVVISQPDETLTLSGGVSSSDAIVIEDGEFNVVYDCFKESNVCGFAPRR